MDIPCNIIQDIMPLYIDSLCSEETSKEVKEHINECNSCKVIYTQMTADVPKQNISKEEIRLEKDPFKRIRIFNIIKILLSVFLTIIIMLCGMWSVQEISVLNHFFFPKYYAFAQITDSSEFVELSFSKPDDLQYKSDTLLYDSVFYKMEITNHANNPGTLSFCIKDDENNIIYDDLQISAGQTAKCSLKRNKEYTVEISGEPGRYYINFS